MDTKDLIAKVRDYDACNDNDIDDLCDAAEFLMCKCNAKDDEINRLRKAIYERGTIPIENREQIDPVDYLRTRYVLVTEYNNVADKLTECRRLLRELLTIVDHDMSAQFHSDVMDAARKAAGGK